MRRFKVTRTHSSGTALGDEDVLIFTANPNPYVPRPRLRQWLVGSLLCVLLLVAAIWSTAGVFNRRQVVAAAPAQCTESEVRLTAGSRGIMNGLFDQEIRITNTSPIACLLSGYPGMADAGGNILARPGPNIPNLISGDLARGESGQFFLMAPISCPSQASGAGGLINSAYITLPGGGGATEVTGVSFNEACGGLEVSPAGFSPDPASTAPDSYAELTYSINLPGQANLGATVPYKVVISNATSAAISLSPCPTATETMFDGAAHKRNIQLDCAAAAIAPGAQLIVSGAIEIPQTENATAVKVAWTLNTPSLPTVGASLAIVK